MKFQLKLLRQFEGQPIRLNMTLGFIVMIVLLIPWLVPSDAAMFFPLGSSIIASVVLLLSLLLINYRELTWKPFGISTWILLLAAYTLLTNAWAASFNGSLQVSVVEISAILLFILVQQYAAKIPSVITLTILISGIALYVYGMGAAVNWWPATDAVYGTHLLASIFQYHNTFASFELAVGMLGLLAAMQYRRWWMNTIGMFAFILGIDSVVGSYSRTVWVIAVIAVIAAILLRGLIQRSFGDVLLGIGGAVAGGGTSILTLHALSHAVSRDFVLSIVIAVIAAVLLAYLETRMIKNPMPRKAGLGIVIGFIFVIALIVFKYRTHLFTGTSSVTSRLNSISLHSISLQERFYYYKNAIHMWLSSPIFGSGGGTWAAKFQAFQTLPYWSEQVHSSFFDTLLNGGLIGLGFVLVVGIILTRNIINRYRSVQSAKDRLLIVGTSLAALCLVIHSLVDFDFAFGYYQYIFMILLALAHGATLPSTKTVIESKQSSQITGQAKSRRLVSSRLDKVLSLVLVSVGGLSLLGGISMIVSQVLTDMANTASATLNSKYSLTQTAASFAPYNAQLQLSLANYYFQTAQSSQDNSLYAEAWSSAQFANALAPWDPNIQTQTAVLAYQLRQSQSALLWARRALRDAPFNETVYRNAMGLTLWTSVANLHADPIVGRQGLLSVIHLYNDFTHKANQVNLTLFPDSVRMSTDASMQVYVATADNLLGHYHRSLKVMNPLLTANRDQAAVALYEINTILDDKRLHHVGTLDAYLMKQIQTNPSSLSEYQYLKALE